MGSQVFFLPPAIVICYANSECLNGGIKKNISRGPCFILESLVTWQVAVNSMWVCWGGRNDYC